jgi:predicted negative regulator of RcsB-dependent stress response
MASHLDLEEQEQLDQLKHFWKQYGNAITWFLIVILGGFAAWNGYQWWEKRQAAQASSMYEEVDKIIGGGDVAAATRAFDDMKQRFPNVFYTQQSALNLAKVAYLSGKADVAKEALAWAASSKADPALAALAKLRLSGLLIDAKSLEEAGKILTSEFPAEFSGLVADKKGDLALSQGNPVEAVKNFQEATKLLPAQDQYRRLVEVKLAALGASETK